MKNYYYNPKTRDLTIFDTESKEMLVLERIEGIRVLTSSEIDQPGGDEPVKHWRNSAWDAENGKAGYKGQRRKAAKAAAKKCGYCHKTDHRGKDCPDKPTGKKSGRTFTCKNCGEQGHIAKTCKKEPRSAPPQLPDSAIQEIAREERIENHEPDGSPV